MEQEYTIDNSYLSPEAQKRKKDLEENPASRTNHMEYMDGMEVLDSDIKDKVRAAMQSYDYNAYTDADVRTALANAKQGHCGIEDFKALLSPAALPHLEEMAALAQKERLAHFTLRTIVRITVYTAVSTATTTFTERSLPKQKWKQR